VKDTASTLVGYPAYKTTELGWVSVGSFGTSICVRSPTVVVVIVVGHVGEFATKELETRSHDCASMTMVTLLTLNLLVSRLGRG